MSDDKKTVSDPAPQPSPGEPFVRKAVTWGRMPVTTFHVGPVPVAPNPLDRIPDRPPLKTPLTTAPEGRAQGRQGQASGLLQGGLHPQRPAPAPRPRAGASILAGSLIPQARPAPVSYTHLTLPTKRIV